MNRPGTAAVIGSIRPISVLIGRLLQVAKVPLCLSVAASALFGFLLAHGRIDGQALLVSVAVFLLACGGASLNSYQDHHVDRLLRRTRERPLAGGRLSPSAVLVQATLLLGSGMLLLGFTALAAAPLLAALAAVLLYNGVYTPLKHRTTWALIPGAFCGALPPYIGWLAAGGRPGGGVILVAATMLAVWQIPHFWLVVLEYRDDYRASPLPSMIHRLSEHRLRRLSVLWVLALVSVLHTLLLINPPAPWWLGLLISGSGLGLLGWFIRELCYRFSPRYRQLFFLMNCFLLLVMALFSIGNLR